jgi:hypothetical protein
VYKQNEVPYTKVNPTVDVMFPNNRVFDLRLGVLGSEGWVMKLVFKSLLPDHKTKGNSYLSLSDIFSITYLVTNHLLKVL